MGLFSRKMNVTPETLGTLLTAAAVKNALEGPDSLDANLRTGNPNISDINVYQLELVLFNMFMLDRLVFMEFPEHLDLIRLSMRASLGNFIEGGVTHKAFWETFGQLIDSRFEAYNETLPREQGSRGSDQFMMFGIKAAQQIIGSPDLFVSTVLAMHFATFSKSMREAYAAYGIKKQYTMMAKLSCETSYASGPENTDFFPLPESLQTA